ncbi:MAG: tetratricopeptide repeat protein [Planctomycetaceae bacterium]|nr:tetratricopeptide repeat protein [Planctomycetaceae bacterium]
MSAMTSDTDKRRIAAMCWKRGTEAMNSQNWDYSVEMFAQAALLVPDNVLYRQSLRGVEQKKYNNNKTGARFAGTKLVTIRGRIKKSQFSENWVDVDAAAEEGLKVNPWDPGMNAAMALACDKRGFSDCAVFGYTSALEGEPENKEWLRALGFVLEARGEYPKARACFERIYKLDPYDGEARSKMSQLDASHTIKKTGLQDAESTRDQATSNTSGRAYDEADGKLDKKRGAGAADGPGMSLEADLLRAIKKAPADVGNYTKLAQHYMSEKKFEQALTKFREAVQVSGDPNVRELMEDCELDILRQNVAKAKELATRNPEDENARRNVGALGAELINREIEILSARVERYPSNLNVKYELARRFMKVKKWANAIKLLQPASADVRLKSDVLLNLGKCFLQENKKPLALRNLENAIPTINQHDRPDIFCEVHYLTGYIYEDSGNRDKAEHHYTEVLQVDYDFRDARDRLERIQGGNNELPGEEGVGAGA